MQKMINELFRKFYNRGPIISQVNLILFNKYANLQLFILILYGIGGPLIVIEGDFPCSVHLYRSLYYILSEYH